MQFPQSQMHFLNTLAKCYLLLEVLPNYQNIFIISLIVFSLYKNTLLLNLSPYVIRIVNVQVSPTGLLILLVSYKRMCLHFLN